MKTVECPDCKAVFNVDTRQEVAPVASGHWNADEIMEATAVLRGQASAGQTSDARDALQEILLVHANDNHRPQAFYIAAKALAAMQQTTGGGE